MRVPATITKDAHGATTIQPDWFCNCYEIKNVKAAGTGWRFLGASRGSSPTTSVSIAIDQTVSNSYSANIGVSADSVSAGVCFSVTQTYGVSQTGSANIPAGQTIEIDAYAVYNVSTYDVWWNPALGQRVQSLPDGNHLVADLADCQLFPTLYWTPSFHIASHACR